MTHTWNYRITFILPGYTKPNTTVQNACTYEQAEAQARRHVWLNSPAVVITKREIKHHWGWEKI